MGRRDEMTSTSRYFVPPYPFCSSRQQDRKIPISRRINELARATRVENAPARIEHCDEVASPAQLKGASAGRTVELTCPRD